MPLELTPDLAPELVPLAWLVGRWEGVGVVGYPTMQEAQFGQEVEFAHDGRPFLHYTSRTWLLDADGRQVRPLALETGFWRPAGEVGPDAHGGDAPDGPDGPGGPQGLEGLEGPDGPAPASGRGVEVEVLLTHPMGYVEMYVGRAQGPRVELATDMVARTPSAKEYTGARRMYGLVEGDLLWVMDMAAVGEELQSHASARLKRV